MKCFFFFFQFDFFVPYLDGAFPFAYQRAGANLRVFTAPVTHWRRNTGPATTTISPSGSQQPWQWHFPSANSCQCENEWIIIFLKKFKSFLPKKKLPDMATFWNVLFQKRQTLLEGKDMKTADIFRRSIIHGQRRGSNVRLYRSGRHKKAAFNCSSPHIWHVTDQTIDTPLPATCLSA